MPRNSSIHAIQIAPTARFSPLGPAQALGLALVALATPLHAEQNVPEFQPGEIVVSAAAGGVERVTTVRTVSAEEIQQRGARTLDEAVALLPGVVVRTGGDGIPRIQVRGLQTRHVKLLLDGIPLNSTLDGNFDPTLIPVEQIARIKLSAGSSSMLYGDGDLGGAINIITRKGGSEPQVNSAGIELGSGRQARGWGSVSGAAGAIDYFVSASRQDRDGFRLSGAFKTTALEDGGSRTNSDLSRSNVYANLGFTASETWSLGLTARHTEGQHGLPPSTLSTTGDAFATQAKYERSENLRSDALQLTADYAPAGPWSGRAWLYHSSDSEDDNSYDNASVNSVSNPKLKNTFLLHNETAIKGGHLQTSYRTPSQGTATLAVDARTESWHDHGTIHDVSIGGGSFASRKVSDTRAIGVQSAAFEYAVTPLGGTDLSAGFSHYRQRRDDGATQSANAYLLGIAHALTATTRLRAAASQHVRFPTIRQLYDATAGDASLKRELAHNKEIGVTHRLAADASLAAVLFHNDVHNYIEKDDVSGKNRNYDHYRFTGAELSGDTVVGGKLSLRASLTVMTSQNLSPGTAFAELQYRPRRKLGLEAAYDFGAGLKGSASLLAAADQYYYSRTLPTQQARLNDYSLANFKLSQRLSEKGPSIYLGANNLFDKNYATAYGFPQAGRFVYAGIEYGL